MTDLTRSAASALGASAAVTTAIGLALWALLPDASLHGMAGVLAERPGAFFTGLALLLALHEALHGAVWRLGGGTVEFGFDRRSLNPYCRLTKPVGVTAYRAGVLAPLLLTGLPPLALGLGLSDPLWTALGAVMTLGAAGDLVTLWDIRGVPGGWRAAASEQIRMGVVVSPA
ncbi:MAG TPA: metalloprotease family protein [Azospirillaceae bacterium]|nr:metalloprotease family protein [Azospirillaceae bacterium]